MIENCFLAYIYTVLRRQRLSHLRAWGKSESTLIALGSRLYYSGDLVLIKISTIHLSVQVFARACWTPLGFYLD